MRDLYMKSGQGFLLVFSITSLSSLRELSALHEDILRIKDTTSVPLVIVGNKSDLEEDRTVSRSRAFSLFQHWGAIPYYETSARRRANVDEVFVDLCRQIIRREGEARTSQGRDDEEEEDEEEEGILEGKRRSSRRRVGRRRARARERISCVIL
ncbi:MAG: Ras- protein rsr1 [Vezdaea aestivalis]|nr:MAG: Ras- protein rsr1 [Vezdaea aestivalis]